MNPSNSYARAVPIVTLVVPLAVFIGCSGDTSSGVTPAATIPVDDTRLAGQWNLQSKATLENGHDVTMDNDYNFSPDGTFTNTSRSKLINGDTGDPFYTSTTSESGAWTVDGDKTCWTTSNAELTEFESFTDLITREMIVEGLAADAPPECWTILSADDSSVTLQPVAGGEPVTLTRRN